MPVIDAADRLVGAVTVDDVLDHSLPLHWRDRDAIANEHFDEEVPAAGRRHG